jgi:hypothetical protein
VCCAVTRILGAVIAAVIALSLLWLASEEHYRGCVEAAQARTPAPTREFADVKPGGADRRKAVDGCSRLPF